MAITNKAIIELYKAEQGLPINYPLFTYAAWMAQGYRVKKGERCRHRVQMWKHAEKTIEQDGEIKKVGRCFPKVANLFEAEQVERMK